MNLVGSSVANNSNNNSNIFLLICEAKCCCYYKFIYSNITSMSSIFFGEVGGVSQRFDRCIILLSSSDCCVSKSSDNIEQGNIIRAIFSSWFRNSVSVGLSSDADLPFTSKCMFLHFCKDVSSNIFTT